jgi:ATP-dependent Clp protease ATP-binding subunit ClpA
VRKDKEGSIEARSSRRRLAARQGAQADAEEARARGELAREEGRRAAEIGEEEIADIVSMWTGIRSSS